MNGKEQEGFGMFDTTMHQGERAGVAKYYLNPVKNRKNLNILKNSFVEKILFEGKKAVGLQVKINNKVEKIYANKEVILSGGSINSPQLLMLSGIGDENILEIMVLKLFITQRVLEKIYKIILKLTYNKNVKLLIHFTHTQN